MIYSGFFESIDNDRVYNSNDFCSIIEPIITDGILYFYKDKLNIEIPSIINEGMLQVVLKPGKAFFNNRFILNDADELIDIAASPAFNQRWDAIVIDVDMEARELKILYIEGPTEKEYVDRSTGSPIYYMYLPDLIREENHYQVPLAYILVKKNVTKIEENCIVSRLGKDEEEYVEYKMNDRIYKLKTLKSNGNMGNVYGCPMSVLVEKQNELYNSEGKNFKYMYFVEGNIEESDMILLKLNNETGEMEIIDSDDQKYIDISRETLFITYEIIGDE